MSEENNFYTVPSSGEEDITMDDSPFYAPPPAPTYLGEVNETQMNNNPMVGDAPIILGPTGDEMGEDPVTGGEEMIPVNQEPTPMQKWNAEWQEVLLQRKDTENARRGEFVEAAREALEKFSAEREAKRQARMTKNREDEQAKLEAIEADLENDNSWQRVCKMVELTHDSTDKEKDVKRMRDTLILLKNEPTRAVALA